MKNNVPKLLIEINNFELVFVVIETNESDHFSLLHSHKIPHQGFSENRIDNFDLFLKLIKEKRSFSFLSITTKINSTLFISIRSFGELFCIAYFKIS